jgi:superfamily II DNA or RNA helicase
MDKIIVTNINSKLITTNAELLEVLYKKYSRKSAGAFYSAAYKKRQWDGMVHFFSKDGKFGTGLLPYIEADLNFVDRPYEIQDSRTEIELDNYIIPDFDFRDYQLEILDELLEKKSGIVKLPTGSGKTNILAGLLQSLKGKKGIIFFTKVTLLTQTFNFLHDLGFKVGICCGGNFVINDVMLCTIQSVEKIIDPFLEESDFIIFDEVHEFAGGGEYSKALKSFPNASVRIGLTATVPDDDIDRLKLISHLGPVIGDNFSTKQLISENWLTEPVIQIIELENKMTPSDMRLTYRESYDKYIVKNEDRNTTIGLICRQIEKKDNSKVLIIVQSLDHISELRSLMPNAIILTGKENNTHRQKMIEKFRNTKNGLLIGTVILQTGINIPEITHYINARGMKSEIATIQALGRALRKHKSKSQVYIYDFLDHAPYLTAHSNRRIKIYKQMGFKPIKLQWKILQKKESLTPIENPIETK